ncbi:MAG: tetratricopeptide repeat protein [Spirochaetales bacterium]|nr:tetratricopeptide repeat protein [Spirochaetales bacterium]
MNRKVPFIILSIFFVFPVAVYAQEQTNTFDFADSLMEEGDYFRSITEYKRIIFFTDDDNLKKQCSYRIALAYCKSNHFPLSISYLDDLLKFPELPPEIFAKTDLLYGINFYFLHEYGLARDYFEKSLKINSSGTPELLLGLLAADNGNFESAGRIFRTAAEKSPESESGRLAADLSTEILNGSSLDSKSPFVAGLLSAVLPGSGQAYTGHWFDALNAFTMVGFFGFATYLAVSYDIQRNDGYYFYTAISGVITGFFYLSNIFGAAKTAEYYTAKQRQDFMDGIRKKIFNTVP